jgi:hypothetical protein
MPLLRPFRNTLSYNRLGTSPFLIDRRNSRVLPDMPLTVFFCAISGNYFPIKIWVFNSVVCLAPDYCAGAWC